MLAYSQALNRGENPSPTVETIPISAADASVSEKRQQKKDTRRAAQEQEDSVFQFIQEQVNASLQEEQTDRLPEEQAGQSYV